VYQTSAAERIDWFLRWFVNANAAGGLVVLVGLDPAQAEDAERLRTSMRNEAFSNSNLEKEFR